MKGQGSKFLSGLPLFSGLPKKEISFVADEITINKYPKTTILAVQDRTPLSIISNRRVLVRSKTELRMLLMI